MDASRIEWILAHPHDHYEVLQVACNAEAAAIRRSYHRLTLLLHPDKNIGNPAAAEACRVVIRSYEILKDPNTRRIYDRYGSNGLACMERGSGQLPSASVIVKAVGLYLCFLWVKSVAERCQLLEGIDTLLRYFPQLQWVDAKTKGYYFANSLRKERRQARRTATHKFLIVLLIALLFGAVGVYSGSRKGTAEDGSDMASSEQSSPWHVLVRQLHPRGNPIPFVAYWECLRESDSDTSLRCHETKDAELESSSSPSTDTISIYRFAGSVKDGRRAFHAYVHDKCRMEVAVWWASRERYKPTATLRVRHHLTLARANNLTKSRKYLERRWKPRFQENFSVNSSTELFSFSSECLHISVK